MGAGDQEGGCAGAVVYGGGAGGDVSRHRAVVAVDHAGREAARSRGAIA